MSAKEKTKLSYLKVFIFLLIFVIFTPLILNYSILFQQIPYIKKITNNNSCWINLLTFIVIPFSTVLIVAILETLMNLCQLIASLIINTDPLKKITDYTHTKNYFSALIYSYKKIITFVIIVMIVTAIYGMANALKEQIEDIKRKEEKDREMYEREVLEKYY